MPHGADLRPRRALATVRARLPARHRAAPARHERGDPPLRAGGRQRLRPRHLLRHRADLGRPPAQGRHRLLARAHARERAAPHPRALRRRPRGPGWEPARLAGARLARRQRPRRREERRRRRAEDALRARRPHGLRRAQGQRRRRHRDHAVAEPGRARGRPAPERLRVRPQPRLVRAHAARDGGEGGAAAPLARPGLRRRPRDGRPAVLLPAQRGPDPPRDRRRAGLVDQRHRRGQQGRLRLQRRLPDPGARPGERDAGVLLQLQRVRPVLHGLRRHRARHRVRRRRHDLREGRRLADRAARRPAVPHAVGDRQLGVAEPPRGRRRLGAHLARRRRPRASRASCSPTRSWSRPTTSSSRCRTSASARTSCCPTASSATPQARRAAAADGRRGPSPQGAAPARQRAALRRPQRDRLPRAGGRVLDPDGPAAEALDPGDDGRGPVRPVPVLLRRLVVEQPAADGRADRLHRRPRAAVGGAGRRARGRRAARPPSHALLRVRARLLAGRGADVPPARPRRHAAPRRRARRRLAVGAERAAQPRPAGRELGIDVEQSGRRSRGERDPAALARPVRGHRHLDHLGLVRRGPLRHRAALAAAGDAGHHRRHQRRTAPRSATTAR